MIDPVTNEVMALLQSSNPSARVFEAVKARLMRAAMECSTGPRAVQLLVDNLAAMVVTFDDVAARRAHQRLEIMKDSVGGIQ